MSAAEPGGGNSCEREPRSLSWGSVGLLTVVLSAADGFVATSLHGAVGSIERTQAPFSYWVRASIVMVPLFGAAVLGSMHLLRRLVGGRRNLTVTVVSALMLLAFTTAVGVMEISAIAVKDYSVQLQHLAEREMGHDLMAEIPSTVSCVEGCSLRSQRDATLALHTRAVRRGGEVLVVVNAAAVAMLVALRGRRLLEPRR